MPSKSQQQQQLFGLALSVKRGETPRTEVSDEVLDIVDRMSEEDIRKYAKTPHDDLPKRVEETLRKLIRSEIQRIKEEVDEAEDDPCWNGYVKLGTKKKDGKEVPNCVPTENEEVLREEVRKILLERKMSVDDALSIFGLTSSDLGNQKLIDKTYRALTMKHHPDKGGDLKRMQDITVAKSILDKASSRKTRSGGIDWEAMDKEYSELAQQVLQILDDTFEPKAFTRYFQNIYGERFKWEEVNRFPSDRDRNPSFAGFKVEFYNKDRSIVFTFRVSAYLTNVKAGTKALGSDMDSISFELMVDAYGLYGNKKVKVSKRDWKHTTRHTVLFKPEESFPKKKLETFKKTVSKKKFTRKDMITALTSTFKGASWDGEFVKIPVKDNIKLYLRRVVIMRMASWSPYLFEGYRSMRGGKIASFPETEETLDKFKDLHKELERGRDKDDILKRFNKWIDKNN